jgi:UDP-N-acetylmuramoyl-L-alanyl-D-glutamate--2,6-diaminopimelate ligase
MPKLSELLRMDLGVDPEIAGVTADSRAVRPGYLFAALPGFRTDGKDFVGQAAAAGAVAALASGPVEGSPIPVIEVADPRRLFALAARAFYGAQPATIVAATGTNGKTSTAVFARQIFTAAGHQAASMGTLGVTLGEEALTGPGLTTLDAGAMAATLADLAQRGCTHVALEASSHGLEQRRLDGVTLTAGAFLNLTQDHLDYHGLMGCYRNAKLRLFEAVLPRGAWAVLNADAEHFDAFAAAAVRTGKSLLTFGEKGQGLQLLGREAVGEGQRLTLRYQGKTYEALLPLAGAFQASNALAAAGLCLAAGVDPDTVFGALETLRGAPGRLQRVGTGRQGGEAYVDYAHTPDGLETVLKALRPHVSGRLIVVFGAGGDRDRTKRPLMGAIAAEYADIAIVTDDNPRTEAPEAIRAEVRAGAKGLCEIGDRRAAIQHAASLLKAGDVLVVAGKGHEQGQEIAGVKHPFDDVQVTAEALA